MTLREDIERRFEGWTDLVLRGRLVVVAASLLLVAVLSVGIQWLRVETSFESYLPRENEAQARYERFRELFGSGERVVVLLEPDDLYDTGFLLELCELHEALQTTVPYVDDLTSLVNARRLVGTADVLIAEDLLDEVPRTPEALERLRRRVHANPLYRNYVVAEDDAATALVMELDGSLGEPTGAAGGGTESLLGGFEDVGDDSGDSAGGTMLTTEQSRRLDRALAQVMARHAPPSADAFVAGTPLLAHRLGEMLTRDIAIFVSLSLVLTAVLLFALFRSVWATCHSLLVVGLSVLGTIGAMGWIGIPITAVTEILPSLLVAVGVADAVHVLAMFFRRREESADVEECIRWAMGHSGLAVLLTSVTTAASMAAFQAAELQPIIDLGRAAPIGVGLALLLSVTLLPALISLTPMSPRHRIGVREGMAARIDRVLLRLGSLGTRRPRSVLLVVAVLAVLGAVGASALRFSQDDLRWLPADDPIRVATERLNRSMGGAEPLELLVALEPGLDVRDPVLLRALREIEERASALEVGEIAVAQSLSIVDVIEETHRALGEDGSGGTAGLPETREAIAQELLLFESAAPEDLARLLGPDQRTTRIAMTVPFVDALHYPRFARAVLGEARAVLEERGLEERVSVEATGLLALAGETFGLLFVSMARSYTIAFGVVAILVLVLIGQPRLGMLAILPNLVPILLVLGLMGWTSAPLDVSSMLVGGILIGVVVDDTIHFAHNYARYRARSGCSLAAVRETLSTTGRAMLVTSIVLASGFFAFMGASLSNVADFGLLCGVGVLLAFLSDVVMMPALIAVAAPCAPDCPAHGARHESEAGTVPGHGPEGESRTGLSMRAARRR